MDVVLDYISASTFRTILPVFHSLRAVALWVRSHIRPLRLQCRHGRSLARPAS